MVESETSHSSLCYPRRESDEGDSEMNDHDMRAWRAEMGYSQPEAAAKLGVSLSALQKYERPDLNVRGIPQPVALACSAVKAGLRPYTAPTSLKPVEETGADGRRFRRAEAEAEAEARRARAKLRTARASGKRRAKPEEVSRQAAAAKSLRLEGKTFQQIADELGVSLSWAARLVHLGEQAGSDG